jgi:hypothetical protein
LLSQHFADISAINQEAKGKDKRLFERQKKLA